MCDKTVVYYTSNEDYPALEEAVRDTIRENSRGLPIVSVSHRPIDFGRNIHVGEIGRRRANIFMQLRIATQLAETKFVVVCEADFLYPPEFFAFTPESSVTYYYPQACYILFRDKDKEVFYTKKMLQLTGIVARDHLLNLLDIFQLWNEDKDIAMAKRIPEMSLVEHVDLGEVVTLKTDRQMHNNSPHGKTRRHRFASLPRWGTPADVWEKFRCE